MVDLLIRNGTVLSDSSLFQADIGISHGRIVAIGELSSVRARREIDASGMYVSPGFIDIHSHDDLMLMEDEPYLPKILQGITTVVTGNCGISAAPFNEKNSFFLMQNRAVLGELSQMRKECSWNEFLEIISSAPLCTNILPLVGHGNLRTMVRGCNSGPLSQEELSSMESLLEKIMKRGCGGLSSGLTYPPGIFASFEELNSLCRVVARWNGIYATHIRNEGNALTEALAEAVSVAVDSGVSLQISHFKSAGHNAGKTLESAIDLLESARQKGIELFCDQYPYTFAATTLTSLFPGWMHEGGMSAFLGRLEDPSSRKRAEAEVGRRNPIWEDSVALCGWDRIFLRNASFPENLPFVGASIAQSADSMKKSPFTFLCDFLLAEKGRATMAMDLVSEESLRTIMKLPFVFGGSDGLPVPGVHPRLCGSFPRILGMYVREEAVLSWTEAIWKLSTGPAQRLGLKKRGAISKDYIADIVIFNPDTVRDRATFQDTHLPPAGIEWVLVGGTVVVEEGTHTGVTPGKILSREG
ncbi:MAG: D-aminoacylase [Candidatus Ratteibacteria bacterium]|jgi:N-acyl-D-amino-acid deacylase